MSVSGIRAGRAFIELGIEGKIDGPLLNAQRRLMAFSNTVDRIGRRMMGIGAAIGGFGAALGAPLLSTLKYGSDLEETMNKFNVVFGDNAKTVKQWSDDFGDQVGRSKQQIADFMAGTQDLFVPLGFEPGKATELSKEVTGLAVDLASFNNIADDSAVLRDLHAALTGSGEVMKKFGVVLDEAAVKQQLFNEGIDPKTATNQQKVMARWTLIMRGTTAAQGDAIRSAGSYANQLKALHANFSNLAAAVSAKVLPVITPVITVVSNILKTVGEWVEKNGALVRILFAVAAGATVVGGALFVLGTILFGVAQALAGLAFILPMLAALWGAIVAGVTAAISALGPFAVVLAAVAAVVVPMGTAIAAYLWRTGAAAKFLGRVFSQLKAQFMPAIKGIIAALSAGDVSAAAKILWLKVKLEFASGVQSVVGLATKLQAAFVSAFDMIGTNAVKAWKKIFAAMRGEDITAELAAMDVELGKRILKRDSAKGPADTLLKIYVAQIETQLNAAIKTAKDKATAAEDEADAAKPSEDDAPKVPDLSGVGDRVAESLQFAVGTFNASAVGLIGKQASPMQKVEQKLGGIASDVKALRGVAEDAEGATFG
ncbi:MAG: hypothetical protein ACIALR_14870 [Blastopirellula sp. JB062]